MERDDVEQDTQPPAEPVQETKWHEWRVAQGRFSEPVPATDPVRAALADLVALKDDPRSGYWPEAWNAARAALAAAEREPVEITDEMVRQLCRSFADNGRPVGPGVARIALTAALSDAT